MKKILIAAVVLAALVGVYSYAHRIYTKSFSPEAIANFNQNGLKLQVAYCQPAKKGRLIFGDSAAHALVPYGKVWRTGANEATKLTINKNVILAGQPLQAGEYTLWTIPGHNFWQIVINSETGQWGTQYNASKDVFRTTVAKQEVTEAQELFEINFVPESYGADMILHWDHTEITIPILAN
ncbi:MAG: DUF2911 domain-containing protein [Siphonobacter sp.]